MTKLSQWAWVVACAAPAWLPISPLPAAAARLPDDELNVVFDSPCQDFHGAMPLGNGDIGVSAWVEQNGDLLFYISKTDAYDDNNRLLKLGLLRVRLTPALVQPGAPYRQELRPGTGEFVVQTGAGEETVTVRLWVDANRPVIRWEAGGTRPREARVSFEPWRTSERTLAAAEISHSDVFNKDFSGAPAPQPMIQYPDTILTNEPAHVTWYHQNTHSAWATTLQTQGLESLIPSQSDPLLNRIFGAGISGPGLVREGATVLRSAQAQKTNTFLIPVLTAQKSTPAQWLKGLNGIEREANRVDLEKSRAAHRRWWQAFWERSWIRISGAADTASTAQGYALQRYLTICGGRGNAWNKFNGSIFTLPREHDPDYRAWASAGWFQNNRHIYWPLIASGDWDALAPFFRTYVAALPLARERTRLYYGHEGAFFPETMYAWGTYASTDYGWQRGGHPVGLAVNAYVRYYWSGGIELSTMMLDYYAHTQDQRFARETLLPVASAVVRFYDQHYRRDPAGKIRFEPAASLETWHVAVNPLPEIAGLQYTLGRLLALPHGLTSAADRSAWTRMLGELPPLPTRTQNGATFLLPAETYSNQMNMENPELYAVFPYRLFGLGHDGIEVARETYRRRANPGNRCWFQDDIQSALLGLTDEARRNVAGRFANRNGAFRFPASYGPGMDELPDMDHGGAGMSGLQYMLLQPNGAQLLLLPAWPREWNVDFKLHAPQNTIVQGSYRDGRLKNLQVTPRGRAKDIVLPDWVTPEF